MQSARKLTPESHVVDILGSTKGRDQPIMLVEKALLLSQCFDESVFIDHNTVVFDPFCKAGEVLLAAALQFCLARSKRSKPLASSEEIFKELYSGRYYALAPDQRHYLLSRRTFYGNDRSHDDKFARHILNGNYLSDTDGRLNLKKFLEELKTMIDYIKKSKPDARIIAVGNPPYQESDEGFGGSAKAIYNHFVEALMDSKDISEFALVIPSRWFSAGKGTEDLRKRVIESTEIRSIRHFKQSKEIFPTVDVLGGVCFFHFQRNFNGKTQFIEGNESCAVDLSRFDIIPDDSKAYPIIEKIQSKWKGQYVSDVAWTRKPFGIDTTYFKRNGQADPKHKDALPCYSKGRKISYIKRSIITKNVDKIDFYKVAIPRAYAPGSKLGVRRVTLPVDQYFIIPKGTITAETYNVVGAFKTKSEAENFLTYLQTDFARYLLGLRKITQDIPADRWNWVPLVDVGVEWTDEKLLDYFGLTKQEREHVKKKVKEWS